MREIADGIMETEADFEPAGEVYAPAKTCRYCGAGFLQWGLDKGWRLYDENNKAHTCKAYKVSKRSTQ